MKIDKHKLAEQYAEENNDAYTNDYYGFLEGFNTCEEILKKVLEINPLIVGNLVVNDSLTADEIIYLKDLI